MFYLLTIIVVMLYEFDLFYTQVKIESYIYLTKRETNKFKICMKRLLAQIKGNLIK